MRQGKIHDAASCTARQCDKFCRYDRLCSPVGGFDMTGQKIDAESFCFGLETVLEISRSI